jgi:hypothetical protein
MGATKIIVTVTRAGIPAGMRLRLSKHQAETRKHLLMNIDGDVFEAQKPLEFKMGEEFEIITGGGLPEPSKTLLSQVAAGKEAVEEVKKGKKEKAAKVDLSTKPKPPAGEEKKDEKPEEKLPPVPGTKIIDPTA